MKDFPCLFIYHKKKVNFEENHFKCEPINPPGCLSLQGTKFCRDMKKNLLTRVRDKDCVKNRVKRAKIVRFTLC